MLDKFNVVTPEVSTVEAPQPTVPEYPNIPTVLIDTPPKRRKPKGKKATRRALKKAEQERDQLLYVSGQLVMENEMLKRAMALAIATSRNQFNDTLSEDALRLLPPKRKGRRR